MQYTEIGETLITGTNLLTLKMSKDANNRTQYIGEAKAGTATSTAGWRIRKLSYDITGFATDVQWANGTVKLDKIWDNRTSYTYS